MYAIGRGRHMVQSVPGELSLEETTVLAAAAERPNGCVSRAQLQEQFGWSEFRAAQALDKIVGDGLAWVDDQGPAGKRTYWFASLFPGRSMQTGAAPAAAAAEADE